MQVLGYVVAAAVVVFGVLVVRRLIRSWRATYGDAPGADPGIDDPGSR